MTFGLVCNIKCRCDIWTRERWRVVPWQAYSWAVLRSPGWLFFAMACNAGPSHLSHHPENSSSPPASGGATTSSSKHLGTIPARTAFPDSQASGLIHPSCHQSCSQTNGTGVHGHRSIFCPRRLHPLQAQVQRRDLHSCRLR